MDVDYKADFEKFLSFTNEKKVLLDEIVKEIKKNNAESLLDIGAGNGLLAIPLSKEIKRYVAVESKTKFVEKLTQEGLTVYEGSFPIDINDSYDITLSSHALSYNQEIYIQYINKALELLNPGGIFIFITFRSQEDDWTSLLKDLGIQQMDHNRVCFNSIIELLHKRSGSVTTRKIKTSLDTSAIEDMVDALAFVYHGGNFEQKTKFMSLREKLVKILNSKYKTEEGYSFPFQHHFVVTKNN